MAKNDLRADIAAAKSKMRAKFGSGKEIKRLEGHLWDDEHVERMTGGAYGAGTGLLVLTDRRLLFVKEGITKTTEDFPIEKVSSVQWASGMVTGTITVFASGNKAEIKNVNKDDGKAITDLVRNRLSAPKPTATPEVATPSESAGPDIPDQIRKLRELRDDGVLTPEEFETKKAELLARM
jgi:hypothetical protein